MIIEDRNTEERGMEMGRTLAGGHVGRCRWVADDGLIQMTMTRQSQTIGDVVREKLGVGTEPRMQTPVKDCA